MRAALAAGLTIEQAGRLQGDTEEAITADATTFAAELSAANPAPPAPRAGGPRGPDVDSGTSVSRGTAAYREKHGLDADGNRPAPAERPPSGTPFRERTYSMNGR
ncbi:hypothetical protein [Streptomyces sp. NPDC005125]